jgi:hypothetical protein
MKKINTSSLSASNIQKTIKDPSKRKTLKKLGGIMAMIALQACSIEDPEERKARKAAQEQALIDEVVRLNKEVQKFLEPVITEALARKKISTSILDLERLPEWPLIKNILTTWTHFEESDLEDSSISHIIKSTTEVEFPGQKIKVIILNDNDLSQLVTHYQPSSVSTTSYYTNIGGHRVLFLSKPKNNMQKWLGNTTYSVIQALGKSIGQAEFHQPSDAIVDNPIASEFITQLSNFQYELTESSDLEDLLTSLQFFIQKSEFNLQNHKELDSTNNTNHHTELAYAVSQMGTFTSVNEIKNFITTLINLPDSQGMQATLVQFKINQNQQDNFFQVITNLLNNKEIQSFVSKQKYTSDANYNTDEISHLAQLITQNNTSEAEENNLIKTLLLSYEKTIEQLDKFLSQVFFSPSARQQKISELAPITQIPHWDIAERSLKLFTNYKESDLEDGFGQTKDIKFLQITQQEMQNFSPTAFAFATKFNQQRVLFFPYEDELSTSRQRHLQYSTIAHEAIHALGQSIDNKPFIYSQEARSSNEAASEVIGIMSELLGIFETASSYPDLEFKLDDYAFDQRFYIQNFKYYDRNDSSFHMTSLAYAIQLLGEQKKLSDIKKKMKNITDLPSPRSNDSMFTFYNSIFDLSLQNMDNFFITMTNILDEPEIRDIIRPHLDRYKETIFETEEDFIQKAKNILLGWQGFDFS